MTDVITIDTPIAKLEFPVDTPIEQIRDAVGKYATTPEARQSALNQWADQHVANERKGGGAWQGITDTVRNFARGTPAGSWLDEMNAGTAALTGQMPYDESKAYQNATDRAVDRDTGMTGTATKVAGGVASAVASPVIRVVKGLAALPQMANMATTGAVYGGIYGAGEGEGVQERAVNAGAGTVIGGGLGAIAVPVAKGLSGTVGYVADKFKSVPPALADFSKGAVNRVSRAVGDDVKPNSAIPARAAQYGDEGMLADIGTNTRGQVGGISRTPGEGQTVALDRLNNRAAAAPGRIKTDLDAALGPEVNMPQLVEAMNQARSGNAKPLYEAWRSTQVHPTDEIKALTPILEEDGLFATARHLMKLEGKSVGANYFTGGERKNFPTAEAWDYVKQAVDGKIAEAVRAGNNNVARVYTGLKSRLVGAIDNHPNPEVAGVWKAARQQFASDSKVIDAVENGRTAFKRGISPDEMKADVAPMSTPERVGYNVGARQEVRDTMGNSSTKWGANDDTAARKMLSTPYAKDKLEILAGPNAASRLNNRITTETAFDATREAAKGNSVTAAMLAAQKEFPSKVDSTEIGRQIGSQSLTGLGLRGLRALTDMLTGGAITERNATIARDAADLLTKQGVTRDQIARALVEYRDNKGVTQQGKEAIDRLVQMLLPAPRQQLIDEVTSPRR